MQHFNLVSILIYNNFIQKQEKKSRYVTSFYIKHVQELYIYYHILIYYSLYISQIFTLYYPRVIRNKNL